MLNFEEPSNTNMTPIVESRIEKFPVKHRLRQDVHKKTEELGQELGKLLEKYKSGGLVSHEIVCIVYDMYDGCILFSEYEHTLEIYNRLNKMYPGQIDSACKADMQDNPLRGINLYVQEFERPLKEIHKPIKEKCFGNKGKNTGREECEYEDLLDITKDDIKDEKILDLGCGEGKFIKWAEENGAQQAIGIESLPKKEFHKESSQKSEKIIKGDWKNLPFKDESFDRVISVFAFPGWVKNWQEMRAGLREAIRVVKNGGHINFTPAAPVLEKRDIDKRTLERLKSNNLYDVLDCVHCREFEELLLEFADQVKVVIGEPRPDYGHSSETNYFTMMLQKLEKHNK
ncbi:MAG: class I SAM-dependent methyltransferase [bacterium]|nr:class I SAM-dependent methyltransferase [bacterium]